MATFDIFRNVFLLGWNKCIHVQLYPTPTWPYLNDRSIRQWRCARSQYLQNGVKRQDNLSIFSAKNASFGLNTGFGYVINAVTDSVCDLRNKLHEKRGIPPDASSSDAAALAWFGVTGSAPGNKYPVDTMVNALRDILNLNDMIDSCICKWLFLVVWLLRKRSTVDWRVLVDSTSRVLLLNEKNRRH